MTMKVPVKKEAIDLDWLFEKPARWARRFGRVKNVRRLAATNFLIQASI
jgi:hypothetical protein